MCPKTVLSSPCIMTDRSLPWGHDGRSRSRPLIPVGMLPGGAARGRTRPPGSHAGLDSRGRSPSSRTFRWPPHPLKHIRPLGGPVGEATGPWQRAHPSHLPPRIPDPTGAALSKRSAELIPALLPSATRAADQLFLDDLVPQTRGWSAVTGANTCSQRTGCSAPSSLCPGTGGKGLETCGHKGLSPHWHGCPHSPSWPTVKGVQVGSVTPCSRLSRVSWLTGCNPPSTGPYSPPTPASLVAHKHSSPYPGPLLPLLPKHTSAQCWLSAPCSEACAQVPPCHRRGLWACSLTRQPLLSSRFLTRPLGPRNGHDWIHVNSVRAWSDLVVQDGSQSSSHRDTLPAAGRAGDEKASGRLSGSFPESSQHLPLWQRPCPPGRRRQSPPGEALGQGTLTMRIRR